MSETKPTAIVLVTTAPGKAEQVWNVFNFWDKRPDRHVVQCHLTLGTYPVILYIKGEDQEDINDFVENVLKSTDGVEDATTCFCYLPPEIRRILNESC